MSTQNVNVARFARNVECDFFGDFQTLCRKMHFSSFHAFLFLTPRNEQTMMTVNEKILKYHTFLYFVHLCSIFRQYFLRQHSKVLKSVWIYFGAKIKFCKSVKLHLWRENSNIYKSEKKIFLAQKFKCLQNWKKNQFWRKKFKCS